MTDVVKGDPVRHDEHGIGRVQEASEDERLSSSKQRGPSTFVVAL